MRSRTTPALAAERADIEVLDGDVQGFRNLRLRLTPTSQAAGTYFGLRLGNFVTVPVGHTAKVTVDLAIERRDRALPAFLLLREWVQEGEFKFQVQRQLDDFTTSSMLVQAYLTVRDKNRVVEPFLMFKKDLDSEPASTDVVVMINSVTTEIV